VRWALIALLIVTWLRAAAVAGPAAADSVSHDRNAAVPAIGRSPWLDESPALVLSGPGPHKPRWSSKQTSALVLGGLYLGFSGWAYLAWYRNHPEKDDPQSIGDIWECAAHPSTSGCDGWLGKNTYAGGADKLGHAWATMVLARGGTATLTAGGWNRTHAAVLSATLSWGLFLAVEIKDYFYYEFSPGDFALNTLGGLAAIALDLSPRLDELVDFRVEWWPSQQYRHNLVDPDSPCAKRTPGQPSCSRWNVAEDYSGQTYLLALHLGAFHSLRDWKYGWWSQYVDLSLGFKSRNYKPPPTLLQNEMGTLDVRRTQDLFLGLSFNAQGLFDKHLPRKSTLRKITHGTFEVLTPPLTLPVGGSQRSTNHPGSGGA
jgi:hypothetical protein